MILNCLRITPTVDKVQAMAALVSIPGMHTPEVRVRRLRPAMGTWVAIEASAATEQAVLAGIEAAYSRITHIAERLHPRRAGSEIERIHAVPPGTPVAIDRTTWDLLRLAQSVYDLSGGVFDPCLPSRPGRLVDLRTSPAAAGSPWALCLTPLALDLGGIAKGYAIDLAIDALRAAGCGSGLVNAGGDLRAYGRSENVLLRHADGGFVPFTLKDEALAVSDLDIDAGRRAAEHQGYYRRSGAAPPVQRYAAVVAPRAAVADALTKCVLLAEERCAARALRALQARRVATPGDCSSLRSSGSVMGAGAIR
jgi:FAD:protein FMN transferase